MIGLSYVKRPLGELYDKNINGYEAMEREGNTMYCERVRERNYHMPKPA